MTSHKNIVSAALVLLMSTAMSCSVFQSDSSAAGGSTSGSSVNPDAQRVETLGNEVDQQERAAQEAKLRAQSEEERLEAVKHQRKAAKRDKKANEVRNSD